MEKFDISKKLNGICKKMPVMSFDYKIKNILRCPESGKTIADMSNEGGFEAPVLKVLLVAAVIMLTLGIMTCAMNAVMGFTGSLCKKHGKHR